MSISLIGCMVGPDFHTPRAPSVQSYTEKPLLKKTVNIANNRSAEQTQYFVSGMDIPNEWWRLFHSPSLNVLITQGLANNPNLKATYASLRVAQETLNAQIGNSLFPAADLIAGASRQQAPLTAVNVGSTRIFNIFNSSLNVSYTLDILGGNRRQIESLRAQVDNQQFEVIAAYITLSSNIVTTAISMASLQAQIDATRALINAQVEQLTILKKQLSLGGTSQQTVLTQQTLVEQTTANLPALEKSLAQTRHALSVLVGEFPSHPLPHIQLTDLRLPATLPVTLPSRLVRQRPDVRAQEALMHAASAQIGVATANLLPQITISASDGFQGLTAANLFSSKNKVWNIGTQLTQPFFHGGALFATRRQAIAAYEEAQAQYRQIVLQAFQNVADTLKALEKDAQIVKAQKTAEVSARKNLVIAQKQYTLGGIDYLFVLNAQQQYQTAKIARIQAEAQRYSDTAVLFQALGGGWWHQSWCVTECL